MRQDGCRVPIPWLTKKRKLPLTQTILATNASFADLPYAAKAIGTGTIHLSELEPSGPDMIKSQTVHDGVPHLTRKS